MSAQRCRIETPNAPPSMGFRSQGMVAAGFLFTGGQVGAPMPQEGVQRGPAATLEEQVALCLQHLEQVTLAAGASKAQVIEVSAFVVPAGKEQQVLRQVEDFLGFTPPLFNSKTVSDVAMHGLLELDWIALMDEHLSRQEGVEILRPFGHGEGLVRSGPFVMLNGLTAPGASLGEQTINLLAEADRRLQQAGTALRHTVKLTVYIADFDAYPQFNDATKQAFASFTPPTRSVLVAPEVTGAALLRMDLLALANPAGDA